MRRFLITAGAVMALVFVGAAGAKTVTVAITKNGYVPNAVTIAVGDTVQFTNSDTVVHQVTFKSTTGVTCAPNLLVIQPAHRAHARSRRRERSPTPTPTGRETPSGGRSP